MHKKILVCMSHPKIIIEISVHVNSPFIKHVTIEHIDIIKPYLLMILDSIQIMLAVICYNSMFRCLPYFPTAL